jgi:acetyltransferase-like isoleucine patch superfamily enzyme
VNSSTREPGRWSDGQLPASIRLGPGSLLTGEHALRRFRSKLDPAVEAGSNTTLHGVHLAVGESGRVTIGDWCHLSSVMLLCEAEIRIGNYVAIGWNTAIADSDFHPVAPALRQEDAIACSPLGAGRPRPPALKQPVVIEDDVWIGPCVTILKGVRIGAGAVIEPGALLTRDVPARARVLGNPAKIVGEV